MPHSRRWLMIALAFFATVINYLDRQTLSVLSPVMEQRFAMTNQDYGRIVFAFMLAYTIMNAISGPLIDRLGTRAGYALTVAWWSAAEVMHAFARGPVSLGACRFLLGLGEAGNWPAAVKVVAEWFPPEERALSSGIFNSGSAVGALVAAPLVVWIVLRFNWQSAFAAIGALGFVWIALWLWIYRTPEDSRPQPAASGLATRSATRQLLRSKFLWQFTLSKVFSDPVWYFYTFWFPQYLKAGRSFDMKAIGQLAWIPFAAAGIGNLLGGLAARWLLPRAEAFHLSQRQARKLIIVAFSFLMTAGIPAVFAGTAALSIAWVSIAALGYTGALANSLSLPADVFPRHTLASVWGFASTGAGFGGMLFSLITGWLVDKYSFTPAFLLFGLIPLVSAALIWTLPETPEKGYNIEATVPV